MPNYSRYRDLPEPARAILEAHVAFEVSCELARDQGVPDIEPEPMFEFEGVGIHNPFWDETVRFLVDPIQYYQGLFLRCPLVQGALRVVEDVTELLEQR